MREEYEDRWKLNFGDEHAVVYTDVKYNTIPAKTYVYKPIQDK